MSQFLGVSLPTLAVIATPNTSCITMLENGIEKAMSINKSELRLVREKPNDSIITYVSTFNPKQPELVHAIQQNLYILYEDDLMKEILQKYTIIKSKLQPNNLKRLLTKAKVILDVARCYL